MIILWFLYGWLTVVSVSNLLLMRRPQGTAPVCFEVMIPARNEESNLGRLIPPLIAAGVAVTVFDDGSTDRTAEVAVGLGARLLTSACELPDGWTGKNRACHELAGQATAEWVVFLDADTVPSDAFSGVFSSFLSTRPSQVRVVSGFPKMLTGVGLEPAYLGWVPWILLATNPFGLVSRSGLSHNGFTNGQVVAWRRETLAGIRPFATVRSEILEDVKIGRLLAKRKVQVEVANLSRILSVSMYRSLPEAYEGMTKNSADIGGGVTGSLIFASLLTILGWTWVLGGPVAWIQLSMLLFSKCITDRVVGYPMWTIPLLPFTCIAASATVVKSIVQKRKGLIRWKGRTYE